MSVVSTGLQFPPSLLELRLGYTNIPTVDSNMFQNVESIRELDLCHTKLSKVSDDAFRNLRLVTRICLSGNPMEVAPRLPASLEELDISETRLRNLTRHMLKDLSKVVDACVKNGEVEWIEDYAIGNMTSLRKLDFSGNKIGILQRNALSFRKPNSSILLELNLSSNALLEIERKAFQSHRLLRKLDLGNNFIDYLEPRAFRGLENLLELNLNRNSLYDIPGGRFNDLPMLEVLWLADNYIEFLPSETFFGLSHLRELHLVRNALVLIDDITLPSLLYLDISDNKLLSFPEVHSKLVQEIKASFNLIEKLTPDVFADTPNLQVLDLSYCHLANLSFDVFEKTALRMLDLTNNVLTKFPNEKLPFLVELRLGENMIYSISGNMMKIIPSIEKLDLRYNNLKYLSPDVLSALSNLTRLDLSGNNFLCNCDLKPLVEWTQVHIESVVDADMYLCEEPPEEYAMPVVDTVEALDCNHVSQENTEWVEIYIVMACIIGSIMALVFLICVLRVRSYRRRQNDSTDQNDNSKNMLDKDVESASSDDDSSLFCKKSFLCPKRHDHRARSEESKKLKTATKDGSGVA